jgi:putative DNA primase/helicase
MTQLELESACFDAAGPEAPSTLDLPTVADGPPIADPSSPKLRRVGPESVEALAETDPASDAAAALALDQASDNFGQRLCPLDLQELFALDIKPRGMVLDPIIPEKGLVMLYATRGTGKTHVALGIAYAVATGSTFLKWRAETPRRVLLVDGEMPASALRERLQRVAAAGDPSSLKLRRVGPESVEALAETDPPPLELRRTETEPVEALAKTGEGAHKPATLKIIAGDLVDHGIGNLASPLVQAELDPWLDGVELLILDNLSSLTAALRENDSDSWSPIQQWLLRLRRRGISVLIVHHAGKGGEQRGTSRREDVLDTSISLRRPSDYMSTQGARFEVHIEKGRGIHGEHAKPFEARLDICDQKAAWTMKEVEDMERVRVAALLATGMSVRDIAEEIGISKSAVHRLKQKIEQEAAEVAAD